MPPPEETTSQPRKENDPHDAGVGIWILATLAVAVALFFGREFFVPIALAITLSAVLRPVVRRLQRWRIPAPVGAGLVVLSLVGIVVGAGLALQRPIHEWLKGAPEYLSTAEAKLQRLREPMRKVTAVANRIEQVAQDSGGSGAMQPATQPASGPNATAQPTPANPPQQPAPAPPAGPKPAGLLTGVLGSTTAVLAAAVEVLLLLLLILAAGGRFLEKLMKILRRPQDKETAREVVHRSEAVVLRYLLVTLVVSTLEGICVALVMWWLKMPSPILWGLLTAVMEFVPYLGAAVVTALMSVVAFATFDGIGHILLVPGSYLVISAIQNNVVSPIAYGHGLKLNPVAVLIGVLLWFFLWGVPGAFLAVPIIATMKVIADHTSSPALRAVGEFLGE